MSSPAEACSASATISTERVVSRTAESPLCRFVQRRACAFSPAICKDHFVRLGMFDFAAKGQIGLVTPSPTNLEIAHDLFSVEDGDRNGEGERNRIAEIDERMQARQRMFLAEAAQQRLGSAAILRRLQPHAGKAAPPGLDFREFAFLR
ncbi:hypothetical protein ACVIEM_001771 [Rhizobium leguminosarum]